MMFVKVITPMLQLVYVSHRESPNQTNKILWYTKEPNNFAWRHLYLIYSSNEKHLFQSMKRNATGLRDQIGLLIVFRARLYLY